MNHITKVLSICLILLTAETVLSQEDPKNIFIHVPGNFQMWFPLQIKTYKDTIKTEIGDLIYNTFVHKDSTLIYQLSYCEYPEGGMHSDSTDLIEEFFQAAIDESVLQVKGQKQYQSVIGQFGYPGYLWKTTFGDNKFIRTKAFMAGKKYYSMQVIGLKKWDDDKKAFHFFDSFKFLDLSKVK